MKPVPVFTGFVSASGHLDIDDRPALLGHLKTLAGRNVEMVVKPKRMQRTLNQSAYWWAVPVKMLAEELGYTPSQMHYALLGECFGYQPGPMGQPVPVKPSSSDLSVEEFTHLIDWVLTWAPTELRVTLPAPGETEAA